jgi:hypothetical protein
MKQRLIILAAVAAGFVGGFVGSTVGRLLDQSRPAQVVRAHSFELIDDTGAVSSYWGVDEAHQVVLAFGKPGQPNSNAVAGASGKLSNDLRDPQGQRAAFGMLDDGVPFLKFRGADGKTRVRLYLSLNEKPILLLEDETDVRVALGLEHSDTPSAEDDNWNLRFVPDRVSIGTITEKRGAQRYVRGFLSVRPEPVKFP